MKVWTARDRHGRQGVGLVGEPEPVPGIVIFQRRALLVTQEVQVAGNGATRDAELGREVRAVGRFADASPLSHHLDHVSGVATTWLTPCAECGNIGVSSLPSYFQ
jgi:hypothetical protein